jgi:hypothetical protein
MTHVSEVSADIGLGDVSHLLGHDLHAYRAQRVVRASPRPESVTALEKVRLKHCFEDSRDRPLQ